MNIFLTHYTLSPPPHTHTKFSTESGHVLKLNLICFGQVVGIFAGFGVLLLVASPFLLLAAPCILCCKCKICKCCDDDDNDAISTWHLLQVSLLVWSQVTVRSDICLMGGRPMGAAADSDVVQSPRDGTLKIRHPCSVCVWNEKVSVKWTSIRVA